jgi:predicted metal-binding membrane protein
MAILSGLAGATLVCWLYLVQMAREMGVMPTMSDMGVQPWTSVDFLWMLAMWVVMMIGMMLPSATPMILVFAAVARKASREGQVVAPTAVFVAGYLAIWSAFALAATFAQWALDQAALLSPMMVSTSPLLGAALLVAAGIFQLTPAKDACLDHCRSPAEFLSEHWRSGTSGAFRMGVVHGGFCLGCCWALMGLLFVGGVMNLVWIGLITVFVLVEKLLPGGRMMSRAAGGLMLVAGGLLVVRVAG